MATSFEDGSPLQALSKPAAATSKATDLLIPRAPPGAAETFIAIPEKVNGIRCRLTDNADSPTAGASDREERTKEGKTFTGAFGLYGLGARVRHDTALGRKWLGHP